MPVVFRNHSAMFRQMEAPSGPRNHDAIVCHKSAKRQWGGVSEGSEAWAQLCTPAHPPASSASEPHASLEPSSPSREQRGLRGEEDLPGMRDKAHDLFWASFVHFLAPLPLLSLIETSLLHSIQEFKDHQSKTNGGSPHSPFYANFCPVRQVVVREHHFFFCGGESLI